MARRIENAPSGAPPLALLIGLLAPLSLFLVGYLAIQPLREFVLSVDLRLIVGIQAWRWAGFGFLTLYTYRVLPGVFAWPAGLGDMAIGVTAPLVLAALLRRPGRPFHPSDLLAPSRLRPPLPDRLGPPRQDQSQPACQGITPIYPSWSSSRGSRPSRSPVGAGLAPALCHSPCRLIHQPTSFSM